MTTAHRRRTDPVLGACQPGLAWRQGAVSRATDAAERWW